MGGGCCLASRQASPVVAGLIPDPVATEQVVLEQDTETQVFGLMDEWRDEWRDG